MIVLFLSLPPSLSTNSDWRLTILVTLANSFIFQGNEKLSSKADDILSRFPSIEVCKNVKFERALTLASMTTETRNYFVGEMVKTIPNVEEELR